MPVESESKKNQFVDAIMGRLGKSFSRFLCIFAMGLQTVRALQCWQCASVDDKRCPENAKMVESDTHDACITWRLGNGTVLLQNVVVFKSECTVDKINFWTKFINLYYRSTGGEVRCCDTDGCNTGSFTDGIYPSVTESSVVADIIGGSGVNGIGGAGVSGSLPGAPMIFGAVSSAPPSFPVPGPTQQPARMMPTQQQQQLAALMSGLNGAGLSSLPVSTSSLGGGGNTGTGFPQLSQQQQQQQQLLLQMQQQLAVQQQHQQRQQLAAFFPQNSLALNTFRQSPSSSLLSTLGAANPNSAAALGANGNCQRYFPKRGNGEWLPTTLMPLSFDRASETKVGVFYVRFTADNGNNDHVIVRLVGEDKSNRTMYSLKLYRVGSVTVSVSTLEPDNQGRLEQVDDRKDTVQSAINLTDTTVYKGFWFTVRGDEIALGNIGDQLINPILMWNDTRRDGPRDVSYFALTTDQSQASFGVNCDVPDLHFEDTCVTDDDCKDFPNTVCANVPINKGLDAGTRRTPFEEWEDRDTLLRSCFCKEGHVRIPQSDGCYDPIRNVVTLRDACFANYHCEHLPNTHCASDRMVLTYNNSCQCIPGNKPFDKDPRTGLIEGCAPLTEADRSSVLGCGDKIEIEDDFQWVPRHNIFSLLTDGARNAQYAVFFVKLEPRGSRDDIAIVRLLDQNRSSRKMYSIKFSRVSGKISICESTRSRSFFFESERDQERVAINDLDVTTRMQLEYVGFWVMYTFEDGLGGTLSVGLNGSPFSAEYALARWTDTSNSAIEKLMYIGFTAADGAAAKYGVNCVLLDTPLNSIQAGGNTVQLGRTSAFSGAIQAQSSPLSNAFSQRFGGAAGQTSGGGLAAAFQNQAAVAAALQQLQQQQQQQQRQQLLQALQQQHQQSQAVSHSDPATAYGLSVPAASSNPWATLMHRQAAAAAQVTPSAAAIMGRHSAAGGIAATEVDLGELVAAASAGGREEPMGVMLEEDGMEEEILEEEAEAQELRNQYLTKLKRLLPSFFDDESIDGDETGLSKVGIRNRGGGSFSRSGEIETAEEEDMDLYGEDVMAGDNEYGSLLIEKK